MKISDPPAYIESILIYIIFVHAAPLSHHVNFPIKCFTANQQKNNIIGPANVQTLVYHPKMKVAKGNSEEQ
jgi:hypothetical protein